MGKSTTRFSMRTLETLGASLRSRRVALLHSAETLRQEATEANLQRDVSDILDNQDPAADSDTETVLALARKAEHLLREVDDALIRLSDGTYGYCTDCGRGISLRRLRALPATALCIGCSSSGARNGVGDRTNISAGHVVVETAR